MLNPAYITADLGEIKLQEVNGLWYLELRGSLYHVGVEFKNAIYKLFKINKRTTKRIPLDAIFEVAKKHNKDRVKIYVNKACALAVSVLGCNTQPIDSFQAENICKRFDALDIVQDEIRTEFCVLPQGAAKVFKSKYGKYRFGGLVSIRHDCGSSIRIVPIIEHCSSGHYAIVDNKNYSTLIRVGNAAIDNLVRTLRSIIYGNVFDLFLPLIDRIKQNKKIIASINECVTVANEVRAHNRARASLARLPAVLDHYGLAAPDEKSAKWLSAHPTHADRLQLFHLWIDTGVGKESKIKAGRFLLDDGDLEGITTTRLWVKEGSNIASDFGYHLESTEIDDNDIASRF